MSHNRESDKTTNTRSHVRRISFLAIYCPIQDVLGLPHRLWSCSSKLFLKVLPKSKKCQLFSKEYSMSILINYLIHCTLSFTSDQTVFLSCFDVLTSIETCTESPNNPCFMGSCGPHKNSLFLEGSTILVRSIAYVLSIKIPLEGVSEWE